MRQSKSFEKKLSRAVWPLPLLLASGCIGVSQPKLDASAPSKDVLSACPGGLVPAADGLLDDFEDGDNQGSLEAGRDGYWYVSHDSLGSEVSIPAQGFATADGGADGSTMSVHVKGKSSSAGDQAWGMELGLNFLNTQGEFYDASKYAAVFFKAKNGSKEADRKVRVSLADVNTHPTGAVCTACYNHFNGNIELTSDWKDYTLAFEDMRQRPHWGAPRPERLTAAKVVAVNFQMGGGKDFDLWVDDLKLLECKKGVPEK
jgi:Carbohydrate binding domain (family 11)